MSATRVYVVALNANLYFGGKLIRLQGQAVAMDRLGSVRALNGVATPRYYPYGMEYTTTAQDKEKFGTYYRDSTTGLDYADQRYYASGNGRFMTPDPAGMAAVDMQDATTWNKYLYVGDDPVNGYDPSGLCDVVIGGITQNSSNAAGVEGYAASNNAISVYPFSANSNTSSLLSTIGSALAGIAEGICLPSEIAA